MVPDDWNLEPHREELEAYADRIIDLYTELAPNFKGAVIARQVIGPYDMEQELGLIGGNIFHGELSVDQLFHMRPALGYADYRTPIHGLYHGSSATHAGGGVNGIPGWQAYRAAVRDRAVKKRVTSPEVAATSERTALERMLEATIGRRRRRERPRGIGRQPERGRARRGRVRGPDLPGQPQVRRRSSGYRAFGSIAEIDGAASTS